MVTTQEILAQAHAEAQRRGVPVVQVLAQALAHVAKLGLLPTEAFHVQSLEMAAKEPRKTRLGSKGRAYIEEQLGRVLTEEEARRIEGGELTDYERAEGRTYRHGQVCARIDVTRRLEDV